MAHTRRRFLAAAGAVLPLPFLPSLGCAGGGTDAKPPPSTGHPLVVIRNASGVAQEDGEEPEMFWPHQLGALTTESLATTDADRVVSELAVHAERLLMVRGTKYPFRATAELHAGGGNQLLTAARCGPLTDTVMTLAMGESIDNWIARQSDINGGQPLTLYAGRRDNYGEECLSYRGPQLLRGAESDPFAVYQRLTGAGGAVGLRHSVNDLVLDQLDALIRNPRLSSEDLQRLELHTDSVRDFEVLASRLPEPTEVRMEALSGRSTDDSVSLEVATLHCDLLALVMSAGLVTAATLQIGDRLDRANYVVNGQTLKSFHGISHRLIAPEDFGVFSSCQEMHAGVNRLHMGVFRHFIDRLIENGMIDTSVVVWCSDVSTGSHRYDHIPWLIAGEGDGSLKKGLYVDAGDVTHDLLLAALLTATGHRNDDGSPIEQFGDESLAGGRLGAILKG
jgi:hypothetical protein